MVDRGLFYFITPLDIFLGPFGFVILKYTCDFKNAVKLLVKS